MTRSRWAGWHDEYDDPRSNLSRRLACVQRRLGDALDAAPAGPVTLISLCAGEGRDVLGVLPTHPRRDDVTARLVELDAGIADAARAAAADAGLAAVEVVTGDAARVGAYEGLIPADVVLACGIFGNIAPDAIRATISGLRQLSRTGATVLWTRHRGAPDLTPEIRTWFAEAGYAEIGFDTEEGHLFGVGAERFTGTTPPADPTARLFEFLPEKR